MTRRISDADVDLFPPHVQEQIKRKTATVDDRPHVEQNIPENIPDRPRAKMRRLEQELQINCIKWADLAIFPEELSTRARWLLPPTKLGEFMHHTPNGGARTPAEGGIFKAMGVRAGYPDISMDLALVNTEDPERLLFYPGWRCELKIGDEQLRPNQVLRCNMLSRAGYIVNEARSLDEFQAHCYAYLALGVPVHRSLWNERQTLD